MDDEKEKSSGWGGARPNSGRKKKAKGEYLTVSAHVEKAVGTTLKRAARKNGLSLSKQTAEVLTKWAAAHNPEIEPPKPDALSAAVNRLADVLEKITSRIRPEEDDL